MEPNSATACMNNFSQIRAPIDHIVALKDPKWKQAIEEEIVALQHSHTWDLVDLPRGKKVAGCRPVYRVELKPNGTLDRFKACLVAKGYCHTYGLDYIDTFSLVAKLNLVRILVSLGVNFG